MIRRRKCCSTRRWCSGVESAAEGEHGATTNSVERPYALLESEARLDLPLVDASDFGLKARTALVRSRRGGRCLRDDRVRCPVKLRANYLAVERNRRLSEREPGGREYEEDEKPASSHRLHREIASDREIAAEAADEGTPEQHRHECDGREEYDVNSE